MSLETIRTECLYYKRKPVLAKSIGIVDTMAMDRVGGCRFQFTPTVYYLQPRQKDKLPIWRVVSRLEPQWNRDDAVRLAMEYSGEHQDVLFLPEIRNNNQIDPAHTSTLPFSVAKVSARRYVVLNTYETFDTLVSWITMMNAFPAPVSGAVHSQPSYSLWAVTGLSPDKVEQAHYKADCGCQRRGQKKRFN